MARSNSVAAQPARGRARSKDSMAARETIALAADRLGGVDRLVAWVQEDPGNEKTFWSSLYPKLLPLQLSGEDGGPIAVQTIERRIVRPQD
jgi:hypothetical protein